MPLEIESSNIVLAIESAIRGGSIALFINGELVQSRLGNSDVSRAEDLLVNIKVMLDEAGIDRHSIGTVVISNGPGSYTGIRIGGATALGLKNSLNAEIRSISILSAMADIHGPDGKIIAAVPTGKRDVAWQIFQKTDDSLIPATEPMADTEQAFFEYLDRQNDTHFVLHTGLMKSHRPSGIDAGRDLAVIIGKAALKGLGSSDFEPIYLRNAQLRQGIY